MDLSPSVLLKLLVPNLPFLAKTTIAHSLWMSSTSSKWDLRTELTFRFLQRMISGEPISLSKQQKGTLNDPGVKGAMWVSKVKFPCPAEDDVRQLLFTVIDELKTADEQYARVEAAPLEAEWTGHRANVSKNEPEPAISEKEKYDSLKRETTSKTTILYFHGGAYYLCDPALYRAYTSKLSKYTGASVFSVRYRLSPQNPFPAALLDALTSYLSLLYPPEGAPHEPISPSNIVIAGDSAGGNLSAVLLLTILHLHRRAPAGSTPTVRFNGKDVEVPLPGGVALNSPWLDQTRCMPSIEGNVDTDYLPPPSVERKTKLVRCSIWPADPPRTSVYCEGSALTHLLVSPLLADFTGAPPIMIGCGQEMLADEDLLFAQRLKRQGVTTVLEYFEAMPHCFGLLLDGHSATHRFLTGLSTFCKDVVEQPGKVETKAVEVAAKSLKEKKRDFDTLTNYSDEWVADRMKTEQVDLIKFHSDRQKTAAPML